jgi:hypothetical protein
MRQFKLSNDPRFAAEANTEPKPFHWAKDPDTIIAAVRRGHQVLDYSG